MNALLAPVANWGRDTIRGWERFWFTPALPHSLALVRICGGAMLLYTHLVWSLELSEFLGPNAWINAETSRAIETAGDRFIWTPLWHIESPGLLWAVHIGGLVAMLMLTLGLFSRASSVVSWLYCLMYLHRLQGTLFGLDQINVMLSMYLMIGPCGAVWSLDRLIQRWRSGGPLEPPRPSVSANIAIRLIQLHLCVIYLFGGIGKIKGTTWWNGTAFWFSVANQEYQSLDMTWLASFPIVYSLFSHLTVFWETFYCAIVWPRWSRPLCLGMAVVVHGGIALFLGMITFGLAMLIANIAFVPPEAVRSAAGIFPFLRERKEGKQPPTGPPLPPPRERKRRTRRGASAHMTS